MWGSERHPGTVAERGAGGGEEGASPGFLFGETCSVFTYLSAGSPACWMRSAGAPQNPNRGLLHVLMNLQT